MTDSLNFQTGSIVRFRERNWIILPSESENTLLLQPLDGIESDITGVFLPFNFESDVLEPTDFPNPSPYDLGDFRTAKLVYDAARLGFRNASGPFRSLAKLSFRPRSYQMVPLIMALKQTEKIRLLIADDVGIGKTIEALLIVKELLERKEIERFAVIALPHLCEQWQQELKDKFGIEAVIIRSNTQARLDREIGYSDVSIYRYYPYQVISVDYIKSENRIDTFVNDCPELVIVDEAHACTHSHTMGTSQHQRYKLIRKIADKPEQNLIMLTATPHSGKPEQFQTLLGLIDRKYISSDLTEASTAERKELAKYFFQRRRADVVRWMDEVTPFPERESKEFSFKMTPTFKILYHELSDFLLKNTKAQKDKHRQMRYWSTLSLLRGFSSSPSTGLKMLENRIKNADVNEDEDAENQIYDGDFSNPDNSPVSYLQNTDWTDYEKSKLREFAKRFKEIDVEDDYKAAYAVEIIKDWLKEDFNPVIFCRFINTAHYIGDILKDKLKKFSGIDIQVITSEDPDELRKIKIDNMQKYSKKLLIATDCLSEGINLQDQFTAILHYDLPWNPNRLEQREGRVDRFGQNSPLVKTLLLYCEDNPIDEIVLKVLIRKIREIRKSIGISIAFPEDSKSLIDTIMNELIESRDTNSEQLLIDFEEEQGYRITNEIEKAAEREKTTRDIFAQNAIKAQEIEQDLKDMDLMIGSQKNVELFVRNALTLVNVDAYKTRKGYKISNLNLPPALKHILPDNIETEVSFDSPTPKGHLYWGRSHPFVETLCRLILADSVADTKKFGIGRAAVIKTKDVSLKTTLVLFRVRNVIADKSKRQFVTEEMLLWGYKGSPEDRNFLTQDEAHELLYLAESVENLTKEESWSFIENELQIISEMKNTINNLAFERAKLLVDAHERFRKSLGTKSFTPVEPVLPMDMIGIYILVPQIG